MPIVGTPTSPNTALTPKQYVEPKVIDNIETKKYTDLNTYYDTKWTSRKDILIYAEGASWSVDYYSQVLHADSQLSGHQLTRDAVYQSYKLIKNLVIKVTSPLADSQDEKTKAFTVTGTSIITSGIIPNEGDMIVADIGENRSAVFKVTSSVKKSHFKTALYEINYVLITDESQTQDDLNQKTVQTFYYEQNLYGLDTAELILPSEILIRKQANEHYDTIMNMYLRMFINDDYKTLLAPNQEMLTYEYYYSKYLREFFDSDDNEILYSLRLYSTSEKPEYEIPSILDCLITRNPIDLKNIFTKISKIPVSYFTRLSMSQSLRYSGLSYCVYPFDTKRFNPRHGSEYVMSTALSSINKPNYYTTTYPSVDTATQLTVDLRYPRPEYLSGIQDSPFCTVKPACQNDYYIFSQEFYNGTTIDLFELCVLDYINSRKIQSELIVALSNGWYNWPSFEKFYYGPIILTLLRAVANSEV